MAWLDDGTGGGHGKDWPLEVELHRHMAGGGVVHQLGHDEGMHAVLALLVDGAVIVIPGGHPAAGGAQHHARSRGQLAREVQPRLPIASRAAIRVNWVNRSYSASLLAVERASGSIALDLPADLIDRRSTSRNSSGRSRSAPRAWLPACRHVWPSALIVPCAGDDDALHVLSARRQPLDAATMRRPRRCRSRSLSGSLALKGTEMSNASSMAKMLSTSPGCRCPDPPACVHRHVGRFQHRLLGDDRDHRVLDCPWPGLLLRRAADLVARRL